MYDTDFPPPKGIIGIGTPDSPFIFPDNRIELTAQDVQNILTYQTFCAENYQRNSLKFFPKKEFSRKT